MMTDHEAGCERSFSGLIRSHRDRITLISTADIRQRARWDAESFCAQMRNR